MGRPERWFSEGRNRGLTVGSGILGAMTPPLDLASTTVGFVGLGNVGGKLAGSLLRNGVDLVVRDLDADAVAGSVARGASSADSPAELAARCDVLITCLPSPAASASVMEGDDGILSALRP